MIAESKSDESDMKMKVIVCHWQFFIMQDNVFYKMLQVDLMDGLAMEKDKNSP